MVHSQHQLRGTAGTLTSQMPTPPTSPVTVELHVSGHLTMRHRIRQLLQLQRLKVHALALVGHDKIRVQGAPGAPGLIPIWGKKNSHQSCPENQSPGSPFQASATRCGQQQTKGLQNKLGKGPKRVALWRPRTGVGVGRPAGRQTSHIPSPLTGSQCPHRQRRARLPMTLLNPRIPERAPGDHSQGPGLYTPLHSNIRI